MNHDIITYIVTFFTLKESFKYSNISKDWYLALQYQKSTHIKKAIKTVHDLHLLQNLCPCLLQDVGFNIRFIKKIFPNNLLLLACRYETAPPWFKYLNSLDPKHD